MPTLAGDLIENYLVFLTWHVLYSNEAELEPSVCGNVRKGHGVLCPCLTNHTLLTGSGLFPDQCGGVCFVILTALLGRV